MPRYCVLSTSKLMEPMNLSQTIDIDFITHSKGPEELKIGQSIDSAACVLVVLRGITEYPSGRFEQAVGGRCGPVVGAGWGGAPKHCKPQHLGSWALSASHHHTLSGQELISTTTWFNLAKTPAPTSTLPCKRTICSWQAA